MQILYDLLDASRGGLVAAVLAALGVAGHGGDLVAYGLQAHQPAVLRVNFGLDGLKWETKRDMTFLGF